MELAALLDQMQADNSLTRIATNPAVQFGTPTRRYIGAEILPERQVTANDYTERQIRFRTVIANHGSRYSPSQKKNGKMLGQFRVTLSDSNIADDFDSALYDQLLLTLAPLTGSLNASVPGMNAVAQVERWIDRGINLPMVELNELMRWQALVDKTVKLRGDGGYTEDIDYPKYDDLSFAAADWANPAVDPWTDFNKMVNAFAARGVTVRRIVMGRQAFSVMQANALVRARTGHAVLSATGQIKGTIGMATLAQVNASLSQDGLPPIELYDLQYRTQTGGDYFLRRDVMVFIGTTDLSEEIDLGDGQNVESIEGTLGYMAIGRGTGRATPGRYIRVEAKEALPPSLAAEGWQTSLPVIQEPEAVGIIHTIPGT